MFNAMALSIDMSGNPVWWFQAGSLPVNTGLQTSATLGYAVAFSTASRNTNSVVGLAFGCSQPQSFLNHIASSVGSHMFRCQEWTDNGGGICFKPNLQFTAAVPAGSVTDDYYIIVPAPCMNGQFASDLAIAVSLVPPPRVYWPETALDGELQEIVTQLGANLVNEVRTDKLAQLLPK
jgi:hypothetical protein